jgi:HEAT repeat protein
MNVGKLIAVVGCLVALAAPNVAHSQSDPKQTNSGQGNPVRGADAEIAEDTDVLKAMGIGTDDAGLLSFIKEHSPRRVDSAELKKLIHQLGSESFEERERAAKALVAQGRSALVYLHKALNDSDLEVARRAQTCVDAIRRQSSGVPVEAVRVLVYRRPAGAVEALLNYLPLAAADSLEEEVWYALDALMTEVSGTDSALVAALNDESPSRRAIAACLLGREERQNHRAGVRRLLQDPDPTVRLRAAQGLLAGKDSSAIPTLVGLLIDPSIEIAWQAEELLHWAAGAGAPMAVVGAGDVEAKWRCQAAWRRWWQTQKDKFDFNRPQQYQQLPGLLLISERKEKVGRVWLCGCDGICRWQIATSGPAQDIQMVPNGHFLLAEGPANRFTEYDLGGKIRWQELTGGSFASQIRRHANNTTFLAGSRAVWQKTLDGKMVFHRDLFFEPPNSIRSIEGARLLPNGCVAFIGSDPLQEGGPFTQEMDPANGKILHRVLLKHRGRYIQGSETWADGHFLLASGGKVLEVNRLGQTFLWKQPLGAPTINCAIRTRTATIILAERDDDGYCIKELNRSGNIQWELPCEAQPQTVQDAFPLTRLGFNHQRPTNWDYNSVVNCTSRLTSNSRSVRGRAIGVLQKLRPAAAEAVQALIDTFDRCNDFSERYEIASALVAIGPRAVPPLAAGLRDERPHVRLGAAHTLARLGSAVNPVVPELIGVLRDKDWQVRLSAAEALGNSTEKPEVITRALLDSMADPNSDVVNAARYSLSKLTPKNSKAVNLLVDSLKHEKWEIRRAAAEALGRMNSGWENVFPALISALADKREEVAIAAASSLGRNGSKQSVPILIKMLESTNSTKFRRQIIILLGKIGPEAGAAVPSLIALLKGQDRECRVEAAKALGHMGTAAKPAVSVLANALKNQQEESLQEAAADALGEIGPDAREAIPILQQAARNDPDDDQLSWKARRAIRRIRGGQ